MYEIKNNINGKIYVGVHKTRVEDDGYMGSGKVIKRAIEKHGIENFTKTILERFDSLEAMFAREKEVVNEEFLSRDDTYNLRRGGYGGFDHVNKTRNHQEHNELLAQKRNYFESSFVEKVRKSSTLARARDKENGICRVEHIDWTGKKHSEKSIEKMRQADRTGNKNSQFGSKWITDGIENKKIKKDSVIPENWKPGRV